MTPRWGRSAAGAPEHGQAQKLGQAQPSARIMYVQDDRVLVFSWDHCGGPVLALFVDARPF